MGDGRRPRAAVVEGRWFPAPPELHENIWAGTGAEPEVLVGLGRPGGVLGGAWTGRWGSRATFWVGARLRRPSAAAVVGSRPPLSIIMKLLHLLGHQPAGTGTRRLEGAIRLSRPTGPKSAGRGRTADWGRPYFPRVLTSTQTTTL